MRAWVAARATPLAWASLVAAFGVGWAFHATLDALALSVLIPPIVAIVCTGGRAVGMLGAALAGVGSLALIVSRSGAERESAGDVATVGVFLLVAMLTGALARRQRGEARAAVVALALAEAERVAANERERYFAYLANLGDALATTVDDAGMLGRVVAAMVPELGDSAVITLRDDPAAISLDRLAVAPPLDRATYVATLQALPTTTADMGGLPSMIRTGGSLYVDDVDAYLPTLPPGDRWRQWMVAAQVTSVLCEPLIVRDEVIGGLTLSTTAASGRRLGPEEVWLARETARRTAVALEHVMLYRQARADLAERTRAEADLRLIAEISKTMKADLSLPDLVKAVTPRVADYLDLRRIVFSDIDPESFGAFDCLFLPDAAPHFTQVPLASIFTADDPRLAVLYRGEPVIAPDRIDFPALRDGALVAVGTAIAAQPREWRVTDIALFGSLVDRAWLGMENWMLLTRTGDALAERELALAAATASEQRFRSLFESTADAVIVIDGETRVHDANPAALALFGATREEFLGESPPVHETEPGSTVAAIAAARAKGEWRGEIGYVRSGPGGGMITVEAVLRPLGGAEDGRVVAAVRDVSDRVTFEAIRQDLFATVAHDLKNPLASIKATAQGLRRQAMRGAVDPGRLEEGLRRVDSVVERMVRQIDDLEDAARLDSGRLLDLDLMRVDLLDLAREVVEQYQPTTERHTLTLAGEPGLLVGRWDPRRVRRVIENLVSNAIKYSPEGGEVALIGRRITIDGATFAELEVLDEGIGIANVELPHVFERFWRSRGAGMRVAGAGIGLVGARQIVEQHGGAIEVGKRLGRGSSFSLRLPLPAASAPVTDLQA